MEDLDIFNADVVGLLLRSARMTLGLRTKQSRLSLLVLDALLVLESFDVALTEGMVGEVVVVLEREFGAANCSSAEGI